MSTPQLQHQSTRTWFIQKYFWTAKTVWSCPVHKYQYDRDQLSHKNMVQNIPLSCKCSWNGRNGEGSGSDGVSHQTQTNMHFDCSRCTCRQNHNMDGSPMETQVEPIKPGRGSSQSTPRQLQNPIKTPLMPETSHIYSRLQPPKGFLLFLVLCLLGRRVMTSLPLLEFWLHMLPLMVLKTP